MVMIATQWSVDVKVEVEVDVKDPSCIDTCINDRGSTYVDSGATADEQEDGRYTSHVTRHTG